VRPLRSELPRGRVDWRTEAALRVGPETEVPDGLESATEDRFPYQDEAVEALADWWRSDAQGGVLCLPTGAGKTRTAVDFLLEHVVAKKVRVLWLTHRSELINQAIATLAARSHRSKMDFFVGCFGPKDGRRADRFVHVLVGSIPTLVRSGNVERARKPQGHFDLIVIDECHHAAARTWSRLITELQETEEEERGYTLKVLGLSATPTRNVEREKNQLWKIFERVVYEAKPRDLIDQQYLATPEIVPLATMQSFKATRDEARKYVNSGELRDSLIKRIAENELRNEFTVNTIRTHRSDWGRTLVFAATVQQAKSLRERLAESGVSAGLLTGETDAKDRKVEIDSFRGGRRQILINVNILTEGTDLPNVDTVVLARPTRSQVLFQQMVGRGMRGPKVGGTSGCRIVVLQDEIQGLVEHQLTHDYGWEVAQLVDLGLLEAGLVEADERLKARHDEAEAERRRELIAQTIEELREVYDELQLTGPGSGAPLLGWWELPGQPVKTKGDSRSRVIPHFAGDDELHDGLERLAESIENDRRASKAVPAPRWVTRLTLLEFWMRAIDGATPPIYTEVGQASDEQSNSLCVDLVAMAAEEASPDRLEAAEERLVKRIARAQTDWHSAIVRRVSRATSDERPNPKNVAAALASLASGSEADAERDAARLSQLLDEEPMPQGLLRLYEAAEVLLGPHRVRRSLEKSARALAGKVAGARLRALRSAR